MSLFGRLVRCPTVVMRLSVKLMIRTQLWIFALLMAGQLPLKMLSPGSPLTVIRETQGTRPPGTLPGLLLTWLSPRVLTGPKQCKRVTLKLGLVVRTL